MFDRKNSKKKESFVDFIERLHENCRIDYIIYYMRIHFIQAPLEAFVGLFLFVWAMICIEPSLREHSDIFKFPFICAMATCLLFLVVINWMFIHYVKKTMGQIGNKEKILIEEYLEVEKIFSKLSIIIHCLGILCYVVDVSIIMVRFYGWNFIFDKKLLFLMSCGIFTGIIWNIRGFAGDGRIDWRKIFKKFQKLEKNDMKKIRRQKLTYTISHIFINIVTSIIVVVIYILFIISAVSNESLLNMVLSIGDLKLGSNGFFVVSFVIIFIFYLKTLYPLFYVQKHNIYFEYNDLFEK